MERIESIDDPRLAVYGGLKDRRLRAEGLIITEGKWLTRRMLAGPFPVRSVWVADAFADEFAPLLPPTATLYVSPRSLLSQVVGFRFHLGVLGCADRTPPPDLPAMMAPLANRSPLTLVVCPKVINPDNLGGVYRVAAGFGAAGMMLGPQCGDELSRRCLRVSMGAVFELPTVRSEDLPADLARLRRDYHMQVIATVLDDAAEEIETFSWPARRALVFGPEDHGLGEALTGLADRCITIPMALGTDSLNLAVSAGIFLYEARKATGADSGAGDQG